MGRPVRVVLVDDHQLVRHALRTVLDAEEDIRVVGEAADGREALARVRQLRPDVVAMDISMPELNGIDAARQVIASSDSRVVMLSTHMDRRMVRSALEAGALGYVLKVDSLVDLVSAIHAVVRGESFLSASVESVADGATILSAREREVVQLVAEGRTSAEAASRMHISEETVSTHRRNIQRKLGISGTAALTRWAIRENLVNP